MNVLTIVVTLRPLTKVLLKIIATELLKRAKILFFDILQKFYFARSENERWLWEKSSIYELPNRLTNDVRFRILGNQEISGDFQNCMIVKPYAQFLNNFLSLKARYWTFPMVLYFAWNLEFVSNILSMILSGKTFWTHSRTVQTWIFWQFFLTLKSFTKF